MTASATVQNYPVIILWDQQIHNILQNVLESQMKKSTKVILSAGFYDDPWNVDRVQKDLIDQIQQNTQQSLSSHSHHTGFSQKYPSSHNQRRLSSSGSTSGSTSHRSHSAAAADSTRGTTQRSAPPPHNATIATTIANSAIDTTKTISFDSPTPPPSLSPSLCDSLWAGIIQNMCKRAGIAEQLVEQ